MKNVDDIVKNGLCIGCAACICLCPFGVLKTVQCDLGFSVPQKSPKCNNCGLCLTQCPAVENEAD